MGNNKDVFSIRKVSFGVGSIIIGGLCFVTINDNAYASESRNAPEQVTVTDSSKASDQDTISEPRRASEPATVFEPTLVLDQADETHHKMASPQKNAFIKTNQIQDSNVSHSFNDYNTIILNNHEIYTADIEGSTAVKGNVIQYGGFTYGASGTGAFNIIGDKKLKDNTPALLVGGNIYSDNPKSLIIESNGIVGNEDNKNLNKVQINKGNVTKLNTKEIDNIFNILEKDVDNLIAENNNIVHGTTESKDFKDYKETTYNGKKYLVINMKESYMHIKDIYIPENLESYEKIIFSSEAESIDIDHGSIVFHHNIVDTGKPDNKVLKQLSQKLYWHFPNAQQVNISGYGLIGNMYAKNATVYASDGSLNGQLVANNLIQKGGFELHNFTPEAPKDVDEGKGPKEPGDNVIPEVKVPDRPNHPGETVAPEAPKDVNEGKGPIGPSDNVIPEVKVPDRPGHIVKTVSPKLPDFPNYVNSNMSMVGPNEPSAPVGVIYTSEAPRTLDNHFMSSGLKGYVTPNINISNQFDKPIDNVISKLPDTGKTPSSKRILFGYLMSLLGVLLLCERKYRKQSN
ncbi:choice-of-anchor A family protein [Staphylococcus agnetis]|uniref:collagen-binding domain-containing protein n=1 Tax=Staphylococcus agnetis TaxID=985762 RepID=UPI00208DF263|nr:choice-of-anchor A family protein [Staphylococcus agnetis]MCO4343896.1 choice-of-anchor A family protein [Staphylococcus agnetis]MCO4350631.1 choice-of-anchor A family protein [Staphylococcus agnetis]MCO4353257.1 choice-of-anchor A family protein [Staphylococcus agnetis]MCO4367246.1 choice-of-anchor A family protein [Staphylococcus agnetis]